MRCRRAEGDQRGTRSAAHRWGGWRAGGLAGPAPVPSLALKMSPWSWKGLPLANEMILPFCVASAPSNPA